MNRTNTRLLVFATLYMMDKQIRKAVSLIRVSSTQQAKDDRTGIPRQLEDIQLHCKAYGLIVESGDEFQLEGISGAYVKHSPDFQRMLLRLNEPGIAGVVFASIDRFFRPKGLSAYEVFAPFESTGKHLFCDLGELDPRDERDQMKIVVWGQMAGMERNRIRDRMMRGKEKKRYDPFSKTDPLPKGVKFEPGQNGTPGTFQYTEEAKRVREAFRRVLKGESLQSIVEDLKFGSATALRMVLRSRWWIGVKSSTKQRDYGQERKTRSDGSLADGRKVARQNPILVPTNLVETPLVSVADFDAVQLLLDSNTKRWSQRRSRDNNFLATGLLHCRCGEKMYHKTDARPGKPNYYICSSRWNGKQSCGHPVLNAEATDKDIVWAVMTYLTDQRLVKRQIEDAMSADGREEKQELVLRLEKSVAQIQKRLQRAVDFALDNPEFIERVKSLRSEVASEQLKLAKAQGELAAHLDKRDVVALAKEIRDGFWQFDEWTMEGRKRVLNQYVARIQYEDDGTIALTVRGGLPSQAPGETLFDRYVEQEGLPGPNSIPGIEGPVLPGTLDGYELVPAPKALKAFRSMAKPGRAKKAPSRARRRSQK